MGKIPPPNVKKNALFLHGGFPYTAGCFTKTSVLEIHIVQSLFLVLRPIETDVRKCFFPDVITMGESGKNDISS